MSVIYIRDVSPVLECQVGALIKVHRHSATGQKIVDPSRCISHPNWGKLDCGCQVHPLVHLKLGQIGLAVKYTAFRQRMEVIAWFGEQLVLAQVRYFGEV